MLTPPKLAEIIKLLNEIIDDLNDIPAHTAEMTGQIRKRTRGVIQVELSITNIHQTTRAKALTILK